MTERASRHRFDHEPDRHKYIFRRSTGPTKARGLVNLRKMRYFPYNSIRPASDVIYLSQSSHFCLLGIWAFCQISDFDHSRCLDFCFINYMAVHVH